MPGTLEPFDPADLESHGFLPWLVSLLLGNAQWWLTLLRRFWPVAAVGNYALVTRSDDVEEVLGRHDVFQVPWGKKVEMLSGGQNFLLGMEDNPEYWRIQKQVMAAFRFDDVRSTVAPLAARFASEIVAKSGGRLDAVEALITRVPTLICEHYYGVDLAPGGSDQERADFAVWTIAMSTYAFGDPGDDPAYRRAAIAGSERVRLLIGRSIERAKKTGGGDTVLARLIALQRSGAADLSDAVISSYLVGMIIGFIPTNTMAGGAILDMLLRRSDFLERTRDAAVTGDDELLKRCLFETSRFKPINLGPFRRCAEGYVVARGTARAKLIRKGAIVLASTQSAMFDNSRVKNPFRFDPDRPPSDYLIFGHGLHWCVGAFIAEAQITQTFKPLVAQPRLRPVSGKLGQLQRLGQFPAHLWVEF